MTQGNSSMQIATRYHAVAAKIAGRRNERVREREREREREE